MFFQASPIIRDEPPLAIRSKWCRNLPSYSISMQWSSKSMGNGYSMGLHHHPSLKHLHEFMYIYIYMVKLLILIYLSFGFISLPLHLLAHRQLRRPFKEDHLNPSWSALDHIQQREACLVNMSQPIYDLIDISYWGECIHYNLDVLCVYIHRSIIAYIYKYT